MNINKLRDCERLNELNQFLDKLNLDVTSIGRKFKYEKGNETRVYTMNQIIHRFETCIPKSITNPKLVKEALAKIKRLGESGDSHTAKNPTLYKICSTVGNICYWLTHFGFNKNDSLEKIDQGIITGRSDLTVDNINKKGTFGNTPFHELHLKGYVPLTTYYRNVSEMLDNGAMPLIENDSQNTVFDNAIYASTADHLEILMTLVSEEDLIAYIAKAYSRVALDGKELFIKLIIKRLGSAGAVIEKMKKLGHYTVPFIQDLQQRFPQGG